MKNEIKVGEYVKTVDGKIGIFDRYSSRKESSLYKSHFDCFIKFQKRKTALQCSREYIVKHSENLIDLIEVGDMVHTKDVLSEDWYWMFDEEMIKATKETIEQGINLVEIVTKEMMESISYKVERSNK